MNIRLLLFIIFSLLTNIPITVFVIWPNSRALEKEISEVSDRNLLVAKNVARTLDGYGRNVNAAFKLIAFNAIREIPMEGTEETYSNLYFRHVCVAELETGRIIGARLNEKVPCSKKIPAKRFALFMKFATAADTNMTPVKPDPRRDPTIYLVSIIEGKLVVGAVETGIITEVASQVSFGKKGHIAIVDQTGRLLAHPNSAWAHEMKDLSRLDPVKKMIDGQTGVTNFYSPAAKKNMIAGFTSVPSTGWGVMAPQPVSELEESAASARHYAFGVIAFGFGVALVVGWIVSGLLTRPVAAVADAARRMAAGDNRVRVPASGKSAVRELNELASAFNTMADSIGAASVNQARALDEAERANRSKSAFLANVSHELRTPLNAILGFSELISLQPANGTSNDKTKEYARDINVSGNLLLKLINDILDITKIEAGAIVPNEALLDVAEFLETVGKYVEGQAEECGIRLNVESPSDPIAIRADERMVTQVLLNLLSNGLRFSPAGGTVTLRASITEAGETEFSVSDEGVGISEADLVNLFEPFHRAGEHLIRTNEGTGLGLAIVKSLTELHGGHVSVESTPGKGSVFRIVFPSERTSY